MKNCPHCQAQLPDEAEFCLYCMTPLKEKEYIPPTKRRPMGWLFVLGGILMLVAVFLLWPRGEDAPSDPVMQQTTVPTTVATGHSTTATFSTTAGTTAPTTAGTTAPTTASTTAATTTSTTKPTTKPTTSTAQVSYNYRLAQAGDQSSNGYTNPGNHIVITGVQNPAPDGVYHIPETIDGQTVIAIISGAFYGSGATVVYIPESVKNVHSNAFLACQLTDVYFTGNYVACDDAAFPTGFNLHCVPNCDDGNGNYYRYKASTIGAQWCEWSKSPLMTVTDENGIVYNYRFSVAGDHPNDPAYENPSNHITITSIQLPSNGITIRVPDTLDGLTVAFIGPVAFNQSFNHSIYIPESVIAVSNSAFYNAFIAHYYFVHDLYIPISTIPFICDPIIHCPKDARCGPDGKVFSEDPRYWNAIEWQEWNGEDA